MTAANTSRTVELASGGTLTVTAETNLFDLSAQDRDFVFEIIDRLAVYAVDAASDESAPPVLPPQPSRRDAIAAGAKRNDHDLTPSKETQRPPATVKAKGKRRKFSGDERRVLLAKYHEAKASGVHGAVTRFLEKSGVGPSTIHWWKKQGL